VIYVNETLSRIKDVSKISGELGIPATTVLRNYKKYNSYFIQVTDPEEFKRLAILHKQEKIAPDFNWTLPLTMNIKMDIEHSALLTKQKKM